MKLVVKRLVFLWKQINNKLMTLNIKNSSAAYQNFMFP